MSAAEQAVVSLVRTVCCACGIVFAMPEDLERKRRQDHEYFYCPNGHRLHFPGESDLEKTKRMLDNANKRREWAEQGELRAKERAESAKRSAASYKGKFKHVKERVAVGMCPCCRRNFGNLRSHMKTRHPNWNGEER